MPRCQRSLPRSPRGNTAGMGMEATATPPPPHLSLLHPLPHLLREQQVFAYSTLPNLPHPPHPDDSSQINNTCSLKQMPLSIHQSHLALSMGNPSLRPSIFHSLDIIFTLMRLQAAASLSPPGAQRAWGATGKLNQKSSHKPGQNLSKLQGCLARQ